MQFFSQFILVLFAPLFMRHHDVYCVPTPTSFLDGQGVPVPTQNYPYHQMLDRNGSYFLFWDKNDSHVIMEVHVKTRGYVGFGLSPNGNMFPADIVIGWVKQGIPYFKDRHSTGKFEPMIDHSQDWILLHGEENDYGTVLKFTRKINTCDKQDIQITDATMKVIYSYHQEDPTTDTGLPYHGPYHRGSRSIMFLSTPETIKLPKDAKHVDLLNDHLKVPKVDTRYQCTVFDLKWLGGKHHIVKFQPLVQPGHEELVHHVVLYKCSHVDRRYVNTTYDCFDPPFNKTYRCSGVYAWAVGGQDYYFPADVGFPLEESRDDELYIMEMHYNNPHLRSDYVDSSGMRIVVTPTLRPIEAGYIEVGMYVNYHQMIPPYEKSFISTAVCPMECLNKALTGLKNGITVFSVLQHAHLLARGVKTRLIRNGVELEPIADDDTYDFDFQGVRKVNRTIYDGDSIIVECTYDSRDRTKPTYGGISTHDEMCESFMYYYPRTNLTYCISFPVYDTIPVPSSQLRHYFDTNDWANSTNRVSFIEDLNKAKYNTYCTGRNMEAYNIKKTIDYPKTPYMKTPVC